MDDATTLYLLVSSDLTKFKIGISRNILSRINSLSSVSQSFNLEESYAIKWPSRRMALRAEQCVHFLYDRFRILDMPQGDGYTEWYSYDIFQEVLDFAMRLAINHKIPEEYFNKGILLEGKEARDENKSKGRRRLTEAEKIAMIPSCRKENKKLIMAVYTHLKSLEPFLVDAAFIKIFGVGSFYCVYNFGKLAYRRGEYVILPKEELIPIRGNTSIRLITPTSIGSINIITSITVSNGDNIYAEVYPHMGFLKMKNNKCYQDIDIFIDLFTSYNPMYKA